MEQVDEQPFQQQQLPRSRNPFRDFQSGENTSNNFFNPSQTNNNINKKERVVNNLRTRATTTPRTYSRAERTERTERTEQTTEPTPLKKGRYTPITRYVHLRKVEFCKTEKF